MEDIENMFAVGQEPKPTVFLKPEYREEFATNLKKFLPELFPTVEIEIYKGLGTLFKSYDKTYLYFSSYNGKLSVKIYYRIPERKVWMTERDMLWEIGERGSYPGDPNEEKIIEILKDIYESRKESLESLTLKRSEIGWSDPITMDPIRSGDKIIRINKDNRFIFQRRALEKSWVEKEKKNPLTNQVVTPQQIEKFIANVIEDKGPEPTGGRRKRRRKTLRRKNLRSTRKR
jgi:hypothetical protein